MGAPFLDYAKFFINKVKKSFLKKGVTDSRIMINLTGEKQSWGSHWLTHNEAGLFLSHFLYVKK